MGWRREGNVLMELGGDMKLQVQWKWWRKHGRVEGKFVGSCLQWIGERMNDLEVVLA